MQVFCGYPVYRDVLPSLLHTDDVSTSLLFSVLTVPWTLLYPT